MKDDHPIVRMRVIKLREQALDRHANIYLANPVSDTVYHGVRTGVALRLAIRDGLIRVLPQKNVEINKALWEYFCEECDGRKEFLHTSWLLMNGIDTSLRRNAILELLKAYLNR